MAVRIRLKKMGRKHRPFYRICVMDARAPRDGKTLEELGYYDPMIKETDARVVLAGDRVDFWLGKGALPTEKVQVLIKKYGTNGTHLEQQKQAQERVRLSKPTAPPPRIVPRPKKEEPVAESAPAATEPGVDAAPPADAADAASGG